MAAATHIGGGSTDSTTSSSSISPSPWHPVVLVPNQHHQALYDLDLIIAPSPTITPTTPQRLRPAARRAGKPRRPRPSRKLPTTYISADAASFRRMVHQVTGADDVVDHPATPAELLCRPVPPSSSAALTTTLLPTLDTSAFLLGAARGGARPGVSGRHGSAVAAGDPGAAFLQEAEARGSGGFPSLASGDDADAIFQE